MKEQLELWIQIVSLPILCLLWMALGWIEAQYFHVLQMTRSFLDLFNNIEKFKGYRHELAWLLKKNIPVDLHVMFMCTRIVMALFFSFMAGHILFFLLAFFFIPFFHDGMYYMERDVLDRGVYPKGWWSHSSTSTAFMTKFLTPVVRTLLFLIGLAGSILTWIYIV